MIINRALPASIVATLILAGTTFAQHVKTNYDRAVSFDNYKTYSWEKVQTQNPLWESRIKDAVNAALTAKGWTLSLSSGQVAIVAMEMTKDRSTLNTWYDGFGGGWRWGFGDATTTTETYRVGTLVVDLFDTMTKKLVWRGSASDTLSDKSARNIKDLDKGVQKIFENVPPGGKK